MAIATPSLVFDFDKLGDARSVLEHIYFLLKAVASQARNQNRPKIPIYDTENKSAHMQSQHCPIRSLDFKTYIPPPTTA